MRRFPFTAPFRDGVRTQLNLDGVDTRYVLSNEGGGSWLTFVHQPGGDLSIWDQLAGYFRDDHTVLRYDVCGHGRTVVATQAIANAIQGAQYELLDAAHLAPIEQSHRFAGLLETFLESPV